MDVKIEREKSDKFSQDIDSKNSEVKELMNKLESLEDDQSRRSDYYDRTRPKALSTKAVSQLKMIASTLSQILNLEDFEMHSFNFFPKDTNTY